MTNNFVTNEHTAVLQKLVREVVNDPSTYLGSKFIPSIAIPARRIRTEVIEASGGLTNEHVVGTQPKYIQSFGSRVQEFEAPAYKEAIHYDEKKILYLRELGQNDPSKRGIRQYIDNDVDRLNRRLEARMEKSRWDAILDGQFTYVGATVSFGIPSGNRVTPSVVWSSDGINVNNSADPIKDLRNWVFGGTAAFRKYKITKMIISPNTARWILDNTNVQSLVKSYFSAENYGSYDVNKTLQLLIPGCPEVEIYDGWYQTESVDSNGKITVSDAIYFLRDGYIFFECKLPGGDKIGEFVQGLHLASGSIESPGHGKFLVIDENTAPGTKGGPANPYLDILAGVYGGVKMDRPFDVLTAKVIA